MTPNCPEDYTPTPDTMRGLVAQIAKPQVWIARHIGVSERRIRYLMAGSRVVNDKTVPVLLSYPEQFALECLAESVRAVA